LKIDQIILLKIILLFREKEDKENALRREEKLSKQLVLLEPKY